MADHYEIDFEEEYKEEAPIPRRRLTSTKKLTKPKAKPDPESQYVAKSAGEEIAKLKEQLIDLTRLNKDLEKKFEEEQNKVEYLLKFEDNKCRLDTRIEPEDEDTVSFTNLQIEEMLDAFCDECQARFTMITEDQEEESEEKEEVKK